MTFQRGSEWRRWDLHIHTPETTLNDQFGDWEEYLTAIEAQTTVRVLGVTDYFTITNYSKLKTFKEEGRLPEIDLLIPNIEFRVAPPSNKATALNIHLLVNPDDQNHQQEIESALGRLSWKFDGNRYSCTRDQLVQLGNAHSSEAQDDKAALRRGAELFKVSFDMFRDWLHNEHWLHNNSIVAVAAGKDGLSGFEHGGAWSGYREEITRFSQMIFSGHPGDRDYWLGKRDPEDQETIQKLGGFKPCIHGSDAHSIRQLFKPDKDRFCWIKADPTFEGLKQILYEPEDRVHIGLTPPVLHNPDRVIDSIRISNSNDWFEDVEVPLNCGLVSIVGEKGSGKSALAEIAAHASGNVDVNEPGSFLYRAGEHLQGMIVELGWGDGSKSQVILGEELDSREGVRYLSQKFVEKLCADDHIGDELVTEIEKVVFSYLDPVDTLNASNFSELRSLKTQAIRSEGNRLQTLIVDLTREQCALQANKISLDEKRARVKELTAERVGLEQQMPKSSTSEEDELQEKLSNIRMSLSQEQRINASENQKLQKIDDIRTKVRSFDVQMSLFAMEIDILLEDAGVEAELWKNFRPVFQADVEALLRKREIELQKSIVTRRGEQENPEPGTIRWLECELEKLQKHESADKAQHQRILDLQSRISRIDTEISRIIKEIERIEGPDTSRIHEITQERMNAYEAYFENLRKEHMALEDLYGPVSSHWSQHDTTVSGDMLEFSIRWEADYKKWLERGLSLFDLRKRLPYDTPEGLLDAASRILNPVWMSGNPKKIGVGMMEFLDEFRKCFAQIQSCLRSSATLQDVLEWLFEVEHVRLSYGLKYNGVELQKLSPGTKGIVLLILYLGMDVEDTRPLIVDQPDENLDNASIYELLRSYFNTAKKRRQVLLITHNPNLIVNTDSEQVVVANVTLREDGFPHITYVTGSLENITPTGQSIRDHVCRILEGGTVAFQQRERRYSII